MARRSNERAFTGPVPTVVVITAIVTTIVGTGTMLLSVYSGLFNAEMWTVALCVFFLALHPSAGWAFRRNRRGSR